LDAFPNQLPDLAQTGSGFIGAWRHRGPGTTRPLDRGQAAGPAACTMLVGQARCSRARGSSSSYLSTSGPPRDTSRRGATGRGDDQRLSARNTVRLDHRLDVIGSSSEHVGRWTQRQVAALATHIAAGRRSAARRRAAAPFSGSPGASIRTCAWRHGHPNRGDALVDSPFAMQRRVLTSETR
jgi:hypothetical protein